MKSLLQWNLYEYPLNCGVFNDSENKHDFATSEPGKWLDLCDFSGPIIHVSQHIEW